MQVMTSVPLNKMTNKFKQRSKIKHSVGNARSDNEKYWVPLTKNITKLALFGFSEPLC
jgi:hypothetical protein